MLLIYQLECSTRNSDINLAFGIMTYQKSGISVVDTYNLFMSHMESIYDVNHVYVLHVDIKSDDQLIKLILNDYCAPKKNCYFIEPRNVAWAGMTTGEMMLALMHKAYDVDPTWDYFVLTGHESMALTSVEFMEGMIASFPKGTNFMNCWKVDSYNFFGQWESGSRRLEKIVVDSHDGYLIEDATGAGVARKLPNHWPFRVYKSIQLVVLSREFVGHVSQGMDTRMVLLYLANVKTADEMLLPTLLQMNKTLAATATCNTTLHFTHWIRPGGSWHPEYLTLEHLPLLLTTTSLFARKVALDASGDALRKVLQRVRLEARSYFYARNEVDGPHRDARIESVMGAYVASSMAWAVAPVLEHLRRVRDEPASPPEVLAVIPAALLDGEEEVHFPDALNVLDQLRRARDSLQTTKFLAEHGHWYDKAQADLAAQATRDAARDKSECESAVPSSR